MRISILIGLLLVALGAGALWQVRNGPMAHAIGLLTYWPPEDPAQAFDALAREPSETLGVTLGDVAAARLSCAGGAASPALAKAFMRLNLVLLGAGTRSTAPVIPPHARRLTELRRSITRDQPEWRETGEDKRRDRRIDDVMEVLLEPENHIYDGLGLAGSFAHLDLRRMMEPVVAGDRAFHACVALRRA